MEVFSAVLGIIVAAAAGFYFGRSLSSDTQEKTRLESELKQKTEELEAFQNKVTNHFETTANLFNQVSDSYQSLYEHMAHSSNQLCATQTFQSLPSSAKNSLGNQPDNSPNPVHQANTDAADMFNADKLYNAHGYRNEEKESNDSIAEESAIGIPAEELNKVVDIESAKEDKSEPALDYAVKEEGVVNHNSLDMNEVKSS